jgi:hypothetical protein
VPGAVKDFKRNSIEVGQIQVFDGGSDGVISSPGGNTLFEVQGLFAP